MTQSSDPDVRRVLVMFKTHLDVGFTDTETAVIDAYFRQHIPRAVQTAQELRSRGGHERFVWTVPAWLLYTYLEQSRGSARRAAEAAVVAGSLAWHALPFTWFTELLDESTIRASLGFSRRLDERFGRTTTAARLTDVPGHSRGLIRPLAEAGVSFLDVGCNPGCVAPQVPFQGGAELLAPSEFDAPDPDNLQWLEHEPVHQDHNAGGDEVAHLAVEGSNSPRTHLFMWEDPAGNDLMVLYHPHAYGSTVRIPGTDLAVSMRVHGDNQGPHTIESVEAAYRSLAAKFPGAEILPTSLTEIGDALRPLAPELPRLTAEIGDTWIYGTGADPRRTSGMRELLRARRRWIDAGRLDEGGEADLEFLEDLIVAPEHNWGLNTSVYLRRWDTYATEELAAARQDDPGFAALDTEWSWKRERPARAAEGLRSPLREEALGFLADLVTTGPPADGPDVDGAAVLDNGTLRAVIDPATGGISSLVDRRSGREWTNADGLGEFSYQVFSAEDYVTFNQAYNTASFAHNDFAKPGLSAYPAQSQRFRAAGCRITQAVIDDGNGYLVRLDDPGAAQSQPGLAAWPAQVTILYRLPQEGHSIDIELWISGKQANRRPEALWMSFGMDAPDQSGWAFDKVGQAVDPRDVVAGGGRHLHGVDSGVSYGDGSGSLTFETLDAHLVAPGAAQLLRFDDDPLDLVHGGFHVNLYNNLWGTAFPQWYDLDMYYRFTLTVRPGEQG
jgi:hypothetical protein